MSITVFNNKKVDFNEIQLFHFEDKSISIFQTWMMYENYLNIKNYYPILLLVHNDEKIITGSLLALVQKEYSNILGFFTSRSTILGGPFVPNNDLGSLDSLLRAYNKEIKGKAIFSQFRNLKLFSQKDQEIFKKHGYNFEPHLDILHDLKLSLDEQWLKIHKGRRKNIRRAEKQGIVFREIDGLNEFDKSYDLIVNTYKRVKLPLSDSSLFYEIYNSDSFNNILKVFVVEYEGTIIATRMVLCYNELIYDWYAGADDNFLDKYPNDFLPWKVLEWGFNNGFKTFDFGGAGKPDIPYGVRDYKLKFGGQLVDFGRFQKNHYPLMYKGIEFGFKVYRKYFV